MRKRVLSFLLAASAAFCFICSSAPVAQAIVPIGLVQSALASYVTSAGYKMWSENGGGELMVEALSTLYQSWLDSTDPVGALTLGQMSENDYVYLDSSGQIVIRKAAADMFQQFADWIQTEYSVPVGSDVPTEVVSQTVGGYTFPSHSDYGSVSVTSVASVSDFYHWMVSQSSRQFELNDSTASAISSFLSNHSGWVISVRVFNASTSYSGSSPITIVALPNRDFTLGRVYSDGATLETYGRGSSGQPISISNYTLSSGGYISDYGFLSSSTAIVGCNANVGEIPGVAGLGVTIAQAVADVVGQATDDDAVVIGVGAGVGATAQDIADMVAQGVKAQTLNPSVSITAEAVIDTPVQPYPDIDGLGLPQLGAALVERFPFCIPWDFVDTLRLFSADPQPINIKVDLIPQRIKTSVGITSDTSFDIDLSGEQYAKIGVFCRWGSLITFCFGLFLLTKRLVWTA